MMWQELLQTIKTVLQVKEGAGTNSYEFGTDPSGISTVKANAAKSAVIYNLAGQRVSKDYKGIVVNEGRKVVMK